MIVGLCLTSTALCLQITFQAVEPWEQDLCTRDHSPQEKVRREHLWRCFPSLETIYRQVRLKHCSWSNFFTYFLSVLARMLSPKCSSEASGQQDLVKTSILTLYYRFIKNLPFGSSAPKVSEMQAWLQLESCSAPLETRTLNSMLNFCGSRSFNFFYPLWEVVPSGD